MDRNKVCCITGHRIIARDDLPQLASRLDETISELISRGIIYFGSGMAIGFDALAAGAVLRAREANSRVKLIAVLPCSNQDERWNAADRQKYRELIAAVDKVTYVSNQPYADGCMQARNRWLVENSGVCVAYLRNGRTGTGQTVRMARERGLRVINLAE